MHVKDSSPGSDAPSGLGPSATHHALAMAEQEAVPAALVAE